MSLRAILRVELTKTKRLGVVFRKLFCTSRCLIERVEKLKSFDEVKKLPTVFALVFTT